jgi:DinB superfamily
MDKRIEKIKKFRQFLLKQITGLTAEQLNKIPEGYNNNIIWNLAHLICAQQSICYVRAGQSITVNDKYFSPYKTNTRPDAFIDEQEIEDIKKLLISSIDELQTDFEKKIFDNYSPSENISRVYGVDLNSIDDALEFLLYHEGFHSGYIISLIRLVS